MFKKKIISIVLILFTAMLITGCGTSSSDTKFASDDFESAQTEQGMLDSVKTMVTSNAEDFSSLSCEEFNGSIEVGEIIEVTGIIPESDYPLDQVKFWSDPEDMVSFENAEITNQGDDSVLTVDVVGAEVGATSVYFGLETSEYYHWFNLEITSASDSFEAYDVESSDSVSRSAPDDNDRIVYRTRTGEKYHSYGCRYLSESCYEITLGEAKARGLEPCSVCKPGY